MRILIAVTHLLGAGHLTRAASLARAFAAAGHEVMLISGGAPAPLVRLDAVRLVQLPPLHIVGTAFSALLRPDGGPADAAWLARRRTLTIEAFETFVPDAVMTELFPFGRRALASEFLALVEAANARMPPPLVLASVRDILVPATRRERIALAHARVSTFYDAVLVHGDPALVPLEASWPLDTATVKKLRYTGYVDEGTRPAPTVARAGVLVAAGSGPAGLLLLRAAAGAVRQRPDLGWRILAGHGVPEAALAEIGHGLPEGVLGRARADYRTLLAGAALSVSQCGYNTATDLLAAGTPAVLVPFEAGGETEQRLRAEHLAARGLACVLPEGELGSEALMQAVDAQLAAPLPGSHGIDLHGAERSVEIVDALHADLRGGRGATSKRAAAAPHDRTLSNPKGATLSLSRSGEDWVEGRASAESNAPSTHTWVAPKPERSPPLPGSLREQTPPVRERQFALPPAAVSPWYALRQALDAAGECGRTIPLLWRDDDAITATPALDRLLALAEAHDAPLLLAVIPAGVEPALGRRLERAREVSMAVHGLAHRNHAQPGAKPAEFGADRPFADCIAEAAAGLRIARERLPDSQLLPVFVPPWNRLAPRLADTLPDLGYRGLSAVPGPPIPGLHRVDATLDPIDWRGSRSLRDLETMLFALADDIIGRPERPIGLLTHHLAHDEAIWGFVGALLSALVKHPAVEVLHPPRAFADVALDRRRTPPHHSGLETAGTV